MLGIIDKFLSPNAQRIVGAITVASYGALYALVHATPPVLSGESAVIAGGVLSTLALLLNVRGPQASKTN